MNPPRKPADFSSVKSTVTSTEQAGPDFGNVRSNITSTETTTTETTTTEQVVVGNDAHRRTYYERTYTVVSGDSLSLIARRVYGKASLWPLIFEANRDQLDDPDRIRPGQVLILPANDTSGA